MAIGSIVDYLHGKGQDSSYAARKKLANQYGISNYSGTAQQNTSLLNMLQKQAPAGASAPSGQPVTMVPPNPYTSAPPSGYDQLDQLRQAQQNVLRGGNGPGEDVILGVGPGQSGNSSGYGYTPSGKVNRYYNKLQKLEKNDPGPYNSKYTGQIDSIINTILNRKDFDQNSVYDSDLYKNYREQYIQQGNKAMRDTIGNISGMTGGYGSSYATAAGQQAYDNHLNQLNDKTMDIYDRLYNEYLNQGQELYNRLNMVNGQDSIDYGRYRDTVSDYYNDLNYYSNRYNQEYGNDYGQYQDALAQQNWAEQFAYQQTQDALAQQNWQTQFDYQKEQDALQLAMEQQGLASSRGRSGGSGRSGRSSSAASKSGKINSDLSAVVTRLKSDLKDGTTSKLNAFNEIMDLVDRGAATDDEGESMLTRLGINGMDAYAETTNEALEAAFDSLQRNKIRNGKKGLIR